MKYCAQCNKDYPDDLAVCSEGGHPLLNEDGIAVRSGHHCAQPLMERLGVSSTTRASVYVYNTEGEIDRLVESVERAGRVFKV